MLKLSKYPPKGFTLIELLVVVLIIGILAAIALPQYWQVVNKARASELLVWTKHIKDIQEEYYLLNDAYAANCEELGLEAPDGYTLDDSKHLINLQKHFTLDCNRADPGSTDVRSAGLYQPGSGILSIERNFALHPENGSYEICYASRDLQRVCRSICGELTSIGTNAGYCLLK